MSIGKICNREVVIAKQDLGIVEVAQLMRVHHVGSIVVVEETAEGAKPIGIVTDRDLVIEVLAQEVPPDAVNLIDLMARDLVIAGEQDEVWETMQRMRDRGVRRCPVVDVRGILVGVITVDDLLEFIAGQINDLVGLVSREQRHERGTRTANFPQT